MLACLNSCDQNQEKCLLEFEKINSIAQDYLKLHYGEETAREIAQEAKEVFVKVIPTFLNMCTDEDGKIQYTICAALHIAYYLPLKSRGKMSEDVRTMISEINKKYDEGIFWKKVKKTGQEHSKINAEKIIA